jgi:hypothetical protein
VKLDMTKSIFTQDNVHCIVHNYVKGQMQGIFEKFSNEPSKETLEEMFKVTIAYSKVLNATSAQIHSAVFSMPIDLWIDTLSALEDSE